MKWGGGGGGGVVMRPQGNFEIRVPQIAENASEVLQMSGFARVLSSGMGMFMKKINGPLGKKTPYGLSWPEVGGIALPLHSPCYYCRVYSM